LNFFDSFSKDTKNRISRKFVQWQPSCTTRMDSRTDMTKLTVALRNFMNAPNTDIGEGPWLRVYVHMEFHLAFHN